MRQRDRFFAHASCYLHKSYEKDKNWIKSFLERKRYLSYLSLSVGGHNIYEKENLRKLLKKGKICLSFDSRYLKRGDGYLTVQVWLQAQRPDLPSEQNSYFHYHYIVIRRFLFLLVLACSSRAAPCSARTMTITVAQWDRLTQTCRVVSPKEYKSKRADLDC